MKYVVLNQLQLFVLAITVGLISSAMVIGVQKYDALQLLPVVTVDGAGQCVKVTNFENGHAFGCQDVDVLLRRYMKTTAK
jgi:hypothetical protein